ncbi:MAG TPA: lanthionine synthetase LanC family protein [Kofleriaceae bacterium]|nr:lanthionine synthetase LanC family protein [Kofleriaceae bacterium]
MSWRPLLDGAIADRARAAIDEVAERLARPAEAASLVGAAGRALLLSYLERTEAADRHLDAAFDAVGGLGPTLFDGLAGVAFALAQLGHDIDASVDAGLARCLGPGLHHDLILGVSGIGVYALERWPDSATLLSAVIAWLDDHARPAEVGRYLFSEPHWIDASRQHASGVIDLGVAHGQGAAIAIAASAAALGVPAARCLYDDLTAHLWSHAVADRDYRFPAVAGATEPNRSAWCYGDPGLAAALWAAATRVGDRAASERAASLARFAAARPSSATQVETSGFCHGAIGLAHVYNRIAQATGDDALAVAARAWYERALAMPLPDQLDLLDGQLGIGLALHAATSSDEPMWDRAFAISVR